MVFSAIPQVITEDRASGAQFIDGSLKFDSSKGHCLKRTFTSNGNQRAWTWSGWVKRGSIPTSNVAQSLMGAYSDGNNRDVIRISGEAQDKLSYQNGVSSSYQSSTTDSVLRDTGWYHLVIAVDLSQAQQAARSSIYVNGKLQSVSTAHGSGRNSMINGNYLHFLGARSTDGNPSAPWDGEISQCYFIDGQTLGPSYFGFTDPLTGIWRPKKFRAQGTTVNDGTVWSNGIPGNAHSSYPATNGFDGNTSTFVYASGTSTMTWTASKRITGHLIEVYVYAGGGWPIVEVNGQSTGAVVGGTTQQNVWVDVTDLCGGPGGVLETITAYGQNISGTDRQSGFAAVRVDGVIMQDNTIQNLEFGTNGFYLPLDGNTLIGKDQSGNGNDWTPVKFGGSNSLEKATGAIPILNTNGGGTVAGGGVRTVKKTYTVTASGGKYYLDGVETPTLNFLRGGTYIFDYTGATSHPFKFSTTSDGTHGGGSEYIDGVNISTTNVMKITVPHNAPDTLYYYCSAHSGMGSSINVTTDVLKADPYAWKCVLALPLVGSKDDVSASINVNSTTKATAISGNAARSTDSSDLYGGSYIFDGNSDYIEATPTTGSTLANGTGPYTIEFFFSIDSARISDNNYDVMWSTSSGLSIAKWRSGISNKVYFESDGNGTGWNITSQENISANTWYHFAAVRDGNTITTYLDGVLQGTATATYSASAETWWRVGGQSANSSTHDGYIQDFRVYYGVAKYTEDFTRVSTNPDILPDTPSGITRKTNLTKITDGAVSLPGTTDYLYTSDSTDFEFGDGDFTIEAYINPTGAPGNSGYNCIFAKGESLQFYYMSSGSTSIFASTNYSQNNYDILNGNGPPAGSVPLNNWTHLAVCRSGNDWKVYLDGIEKWHGNAAGSIEDNSYGFSIGDYGPAPSNYEFQGFISNFRVIKGTALYTSNFKPPTKPLTAVTNTKLLCCQSNTSATAAAVAPTSGVNDGTVWSEESTITYDGAPDTTYTTGRVAAMFDGGSSTAFGVNNGSSNRFVNIVFPAGITVSSSVKVYATFRTGMEWSINGSIVTSTGVSHPNTGVQTLGFTSGTMFTLRCQVANGNALEIYYIEVDGVRLQDPVSSFGQAAATNFNPFTDDINNIRGQETSYATFNPLDKNSGATLSNGNLKIQTTTNVWKNTPTSIGMKTGKFYCEFGPNLWSDSNNHCQPGVRSMALGNSFEMGGTNYTGFYHYTGTTLFNGQGGAGTSFGDAWNDSSYNIIGVAFDADTRKVWFSKNGTWQGGGNPSAGTNEAGIINPIGNDGSYAFCLGTHGNGGLPNGGAEANFGQKPFKFPPPDGFQPLNLSNVQPEKVIARPDQYVSATLFTGTGDAVSSRTVELPQDADLVWAKSRDRSSGHQLADTVRGNNSVLQSNTNSTARNPTTQYVGGGISTIDGKTITIASGTTNNQNLNVVNQRGVIWSWKAGGSKGTFNIDDVGYANASDVSMNVGALNNYNTDQTWSNGLAGSGSGGGWASGEGPTVAFDGDTDTRARWTGTSSGVITATLPTAISATKLRVKGHFFKNNTTANEDVMISVNGGTYVIPSDAGLTTYAEIQAAAGNNLFIDCSSLITGGQVSSVSIKRRGSVSSASGLTIYAIEVDGNILVDSNQTPPNIPSIAPTGCSVGTKQGFSIIKYDGAGTSTSSTPSKIPHGLSQAPSFFIVKAVSGTNANDDWVCYHQSLGSSFRIRLNLTNVADTQSNLWGNATDPTSSVISINKGWYSVNYTGHTHILYAWHDVPGLQKFGMWTNNNNNDGAFIELGFKPALILLKNTDNVEKWYWIDSSRHPNNLVEPSSSAAGAVNTLQANSSNTEATSRGSHSNTTVDILSNGFKIRTTNPAAGEISYGTRNYIYAAWAEAPSFNLYGAQSNAR